MPSRMKTLSRLFHSFTQLRPRSFSAGMLTGAGALAVGFTMGGLQHTPPTTPSHATPSADPTAPTDATFSILTAQEIHLVNEQGVTVLRLDAMERGGAMRVFSANGTPLVALGAGPVGGALEMHDLAGVRRADLAGNGVLTVRNDAGLPRARLSPYKTGGNVINDYSGQFIAIDRNGAIVERIPE